MRSRERKLVFLLVLTVATLLVLAGATAFRTTSAAVVAQDTSRSDVKAKARHAHTPHAVAVAPANDNCANGIVVNACPFTDTKDTSGATDEAGEPQSTCTLQSNSVWYTVAPSAQTRIFNVSTCNSSPVDTAIMVWQVPTATPCSFANFVAVGCNDDFCGDGFQSSVQFTANPATAYKIQVGGFDGDTGTIETDITCVSLNCPPVVINGTLGSGDPNFTGPHSSGNVTGRLNRNGISSTCAAPKTCLIFDPANPRAFDSYSIPNQSGQAVCVSVNLAEDDKGSCNLQSNAYLGTFNPAAICTNYLADPGLSTGVPPTATNMSFTVPAGQTLTVVVMTTNPGETGCNYTLTILGDLCSQFDYCVQDDNNPRRFILINSQTGDYEFHDCSKGITLKGKGTVVTDFCKIDLFDSGPNPKKPDRSIFVEVNTCTFRGNASVRIPGSVTTVNLADSNFTNNNCKCP